MVDLLIPYENEFMWLHHSTYLPEGVVDIWCLMKISWCDCPILIYLSGCATRLAKSKQPLSHSATLPEWLDQPLSHSATLAERLDQPLSHSATLSDWVAEWLVQPLLPQRLSGWVAEWLSGLVQPLSHSATLPERLSGWAAAPSHSGRMSQCVNS